MQNTVTTRRTTHNWLATAILLAASAAIVALVVALNDNPIPAPPLAPAVAAAAVVRVPAAGYAALKDRQLSQTDPAPVKAAAGSIPAHDRYATVKDQQLARAEAALGNFSLTRNNYVALKDQQFERAGAVPVAPISSLAQTSAERYGNLKDAQFDQANGVRGTISLRWARYMTLKDEQLATAGW